jgi:hypothetical protein
MDSGLGDDAPDTEDAAPEPPMGVDTKEAFAQRDKARNLKDGVGCELVKLHTVDKDRSTKEQGKHYPEVFLRAGNDFLDGHRHIRGGAQLVEVGLGEGRHRPSGGLILHRGRTSATCVLPLWLAHGVGGGTERWKSKNYEEINSGGARKKKM